MIYEGLRSIRDMANEEHHIYGRYSSTLTVRGDHSFLLHGKPFAIQVYTGQYINKLTRVRIHSNIFRAAYEFAFGAAWYHWIDKREREVLPIIVQQLNIKLDGLDVVKFYQEESCCEY